MMYIKMLSKGQVHVISPQENFSSPVLPLSLWSSPRKALGEYSMHIVEVEKNLKAESWQQSYDVDQDIALVFVKASMTLGCLHSSAVHCVGIRE